MYKLLLIAALALVAVMAEPEADAYYYGRGYGLGGYYGRGYYNRGYHGGYYGRGYYGRYRREAEAEPEAEADADALITYGGYYPYASTYVNRFYNNGYYPYASYAYGSHFIGKREAEAEPYYYGRGYGGYGGYYGRGYYNRGYHGRGNYNRGYYY